MWYWLPVFIYFLIPGTLMAEDINAGFVRGFWYSNDTVFAEKPVRVYVAIRNNTGSDLTGTVTFLDNDKRIGTQAVSALDGRIIESWIDWKPSYGEHTLKAELSRLKLSAVGEDTESVDASLAAATDTIFVDYDLDDDGEGNKTDVDDDGDGASDVDEVKRGSDPLQPEKNNTVETLNRDTAVSNTPPGTLAAPTNTAPTLPDVRGGLERYLTPSRADTLLTGVTALADKAKQKIDTYREKRDATRAEINNDTVVNSDGFGEITRSVNDAASTPPSAGSGVVSDISRFLSTLIGGVWTSLLFTSSWLLGHTILIQLLLLIGTLVGLYFLARTLGQRPLTKTKKK